MLHTLRTKLTTFRICTQHQNCDCTAAQVEPKQLPRVVGEQKNSVQPLSEGREWLRRAEVQGHGVSLETKLKGKNDPTLDFSGEREEPVSLWGR